MRNRLHEIAPVSALQVDIVIEPSLAGKTPELMQRVGFAGKSLLVVCDANTHKALGSRIMHELCSSARLLMLDNPQADGTTLAKIAANEAEAIIAVGSGTINDLCKYASFKAGVPYAVFATAPSMNGYISANASLTTHGHKKSLAAQLPAAVFCDLGVLAAAPLRLIRSGLGDSVCRPTAQADWLLSHLLLGTPYDPLPFTFLEPYEDDLLNAAPQLAERRPYAIELLMRTLLASGLGMTVAGGSYPASQGEHMIAHTMEMKHGNALPHTLHGEQIGVTTLIMARLQHDILEKPVRLRRHSGWQETAAAYFGEGTKTEIVEAAHKKFALAEARFDEINELLATEKFYLRDALHHVMRPAAVIEAALLKAGAPTTPEALGWDAAALDAALHHACFMRDRFTFLDLI